ncbi:hypothetical protein ABKN59_004320 [Abortiporus biennis]
MYCIFCIDRKTYYANQFDYAAVRWRESLNVTMPSYFSLAAARRLKLHTIFTQSPSWNRYSKNVVRLVVKDEAKPKPRTAKRVEFKITISVQLHIWSIVRPMDGGDDDSLSRSTNIFCWLLSSQRPDSYLEGTKSKMSLYAFRQKHVFRQFISRMVMMRRHIKLDDDLMERERKEGEPFF